MKIVYTNADQFTNTKKCELIELIEREEPHIVAINEVKPKNGHVIRMHIQKNRGNTNNFYTICKQDRFVEAICGL